MCLLKYTIAAEYRRSACTNETHSLALLQDLIPTLAAYTFLTFYYLVRSLLPFLNLIFL